MLKAGKRPAQIALKLNRTPRAVYRRMYKLGLSCGQGSVARAGAPG
jgi:DNA-binding CsgD family transcriptional regulator